MKKIYLFAVIALMMSIAACSDDALQQRVHELEQRIQNDSLLMESIDKDFEEIGNGLAAAMKFTNEASSGIMTKNQFASNVQTVTQTLEKNSKKIAELTKELEKAQGSAKNAKILLEQLEQKSAQIVSLKKQILDLESKMAILKEDNAQLTKTVRIQEGTINVMSQDIAQAQAELNALKSQIAQAKTQNEKAQSDLTDSYLNAGVLMMEVADKIDGVFKPKAKAAATQQAFDFFCAAHKRGHYNALTYLNQLQSDKEFSKHLKGKSCK